MLLLQRRGGGLRLALRSRRGDGAFTSALRLRLLLLLLLLPLLLPLPPLLLFGMCDGGADHPIDETSKEK